MMAFLIKEYFTLFHLKISKRSWCIGINRVKNNKIHYLLLNLKNICLRITKFMNLALSANITMYVE